MKRGYRKRNDEARMSKDAGIAIPSPWKAEIDRGRCSGRLPRGESVRLAGVLATPKLGEGGSPASMEKLQPRTLSGLPLQLHGGSRSLPLHLAVRRSQHDVLYHSLFTMTYGRGGGVGRGLGVGASLGVGVGLAVAVAVAVGVGVGLGPQGLVGQLKISVEARDPRFSSMPPASQMLLVPSVSLAELRRAVTNGVPIDHVLLTGS